MRWHTAVGALRFASWLGLFAPKPSRPNSISARERLGTFPTDSIPSTSAITVRWNERMIPFVEAESDRDLAVGLGLVHAHLRLGQMEVMRRISQGRISEMIGPAALDVDRTVRTFDLGRAVPQVLGQLPAATREWLEGFVAGINRVLMGPGALPHEFAVFDLRREPWTVRDILQLGRLLAFDANWLVWVRLMRVRGKPGWHELWRKLIATGAERTPEDSMLGTIEGAALGAVFGTNNRSGSNAYAVSGARAGKAWIASDPHLGLSLPSNWLIAGMKSPGFHAVGMMIPGAPVMALGRNRWIAWGGTSLHAHVSDLCDVSKVPESDIATRTETIAMRWSSPHDVTVRDCPSGPIISDSIFYRNGGARLALRWIGHQPSDEVSAMLGIARAHDWESFKQAVDGIAVPGLNMIYADAQGHIGHAFAAHIPKNAHPMPDDIVGSPDDNWDDCFSTLSLPARSDPAKGFVVSANDRPVETDIVIGRMFSSSGRADRIAALLNGAAKIDLDLFATIQQDVKAESARACAQALVTAARTAAALPAGAGKISALMQAWNGFYAADSVGAAAFEFTLYHFAQLYYRPEIRTAYAASWAMRDLVRGDIEAANPTEIAPVVVDALARAARELKGQRWGDVHRLRLFHPLGALPIAGKRYCFYDLPTSGSSDTVMKTASGLAHGRHGSRFGANARHVSDLSDLDANYFVLLGGQDGWFGSACFTDQVTEWRVGKHIRVPMTDSAVNDAFPVVMTLAPAPRPEPKLRAVPTAAAS